MSVHLYPWQYVKRAQDVGLLEKRMSVKNVFIWHKLVQLPASPFDIKDYFQFQAKGT